MLLPIGHEHGTVRRMPWVTFTVMGLCTVVWLLTLLAPGDEARVAARERAAVEYWSEHPYLELHPDLRGTTWLTRRQQLGELPAAPQDGSRRVREQRELDRRADQFLAARDALPYFRWGLVPSRITLPTLLTHQFLHAGFLHLFGNLFILYLVGPVLEDAWGRPLFASFYLGSGVVAALVFIARYPTLDEPMIGASGAIAGVMGAFAVRFWDTRITFFYWIFFLKIYTGTFAAPAWVMLGLWFLRELLYAQGLWAFTALGDAGQVAFLAHVGGFVFGAAVAFVAVRLRVEERWIRPALERRETVHDAGEVEQALESARLGRHEEAMARLERRLQQAPDDADAAAALWRIAAAAHQTFRALPAVIEALRRAARRGDGGLATMVWSEVLAVCEPSAIDLATVIRTGELLAAAELDGEVDLTLDRAEALLDGTTPPGLAARLERLSASRGRTPSRARRVTGDGAATASGSAGSGRPRVVVAVPLSLEGDRLEVEVSGRRRALPLDGIGACRVAVVAAPGARPYLVADLELGDPGSGGPPRILRLRACDFDPTRVIPSSRPLDAFLELVRRLGGAAADPGSLPRYRSEEELTA